MSFRIWLVKIIRTISYRIDVWMYGWYYTDHVELDFRELNSLVMSFVQYANEKESETRNVIGAKCRVI